MILKKQSIRIIVYIYLLGIAVVAFVPFGGVNVKLQEVDVFSLRLDYLIHFLVFLPLVPLWRMVWPHHPLWKVLLFTLAIAASAEIVQYILPYRSFNPYDLIANCLGTIAGMLIAIMYPSSQVESKK